MPASKTRLGWTLLLTVAVAHADISKVSPDLQASLATPGKSVDVIVQYASPVSTCSTGLLGAVLCVPVNLLGGVLNGVLTLVNAVTATLPAGNLLALSNLPNVAYISPDRHVVTMSSPAADLEAATTNAPVAWSSGWNGAGVGVAVIDSGIFAHPDLNGRVVYRQSFVGGTLTDDFGHGTHVAGILAGVGGVAPQANLLDLRVLDVSGVSSDSAVIAALQTAVALKSKYNVRVVNLSLGRPIYETCNLDPLCLAVENTYKNGIVVVAAAGNLGRNGYSTILSPGNSPHAITVGAMKSEGTPNRSDDLVASYSSRGPSYIDQTVKPDLVAPGNLVTSCLAPGSTLVNEYPANVVAPNHFILSGTSMATPAVSAAAAILIQKDPTLTPDSVKARLMKTASKSFPVSSTATDPTTGLKYTDDYDVFTIGAGYLDIGAAIANYDVARLSSTSPAAIYNVFSHQASFLFLPTEVWASTSAFTPGIVWGNTVVSGSNYNNYTLWNSSNVWSTSAAWGTSVAWGTSAAWGTSVAWGTSAAWGTSVAWGTSGVGEQ